MGQVLQFRLPKQPVVMPDSDALDLMSAVDFALRDLKDIMPHITLDSARQQAQACHQMLLDAFQAELAAAE